MPLSLLPKPASYVVFSINPVATLESLNDPVALAAARQMAPEKYVGYVNKVVDVFDSHARYHTYSILLTSPTVPAASEADLIGADMYTPVFPVTAHPLGREPLHPNKALPWKTCYQPSFMRSVVRVPVTVADDSAAISLEPSDVTRHRMILFGEDVRRNASVHSSTPPEKLGEDPSSSYIDFSDLDDYTGDISCPIDVDRTYEDRYYADTVEASRPADTVIVVDVSYDLSEISELPDPLGFFEEKRFIKKLEAESKARTSKRVISAPFKLESETQHAMEEVQPMVDSEAGQPWAFTNYRGLPELLSTIRIPVSVIRGLATMTRRLSIFWTHGVWCTF
ncbi:hypothetical protein B0H10DRAFT_2121876 [Mycena sp. CBHHK59/15]|nr:hypothetical protein B0H10DRAFT_2121876 [Mycena sp. CBHHK59/15]